MLLGVATTSGASADLRSTKPPPTRVGITDPCWTSGRAVPTSAPFTSSTVQSGCRWSRSATAPETCGAAMLVPDSSVQPPGTDESTSTPGAVTSGLRRCEMLVGPSEENEATLLRIGDAVAAATVIARTELAGDPTDP